MFRGAARNVGDNVGDNRDAYELDLAAGAPTEELELALALSSSVESMYSAIVVKANAASAAAANAAVADLAANNAAYAARYAALSNAVAAKPEAKNEKDKRLSADPECQICYDAPRTTLFEPCNHVICCTSCSKLMKKCPMCQCDITVRKRVFL